MSKQVLTPSQSAALDKILSSQQKMMALTGYAGTGKTTLCLYIIEELQKRGWDCKLAAPTWKAAQVLSDKTGMDASSLHSVLYGGAFSLMEHNRKVKEMILKGEITEEEAAEKYEKKSTLVFENPSLDNDTFYFIDEGSMIGDKQFTDWVRALAATNSKVLFVGDPGQLPPFKEQMSIAPLYSPTATLTEVMRHHDGTDIDVAANKIREEGWMSLPYLNARNVKVINGTASGGIDLDEFDIVISPTNKQRVSYNKRILNRDLVSAPLIQGDTVMMQETKGVFLNSDIFEIVDSVMDYRKVGDKTVMCHKAQVEGIGNELWILPCLGEESKDKAGHKLGLELSKIRKRPVLAFYANAVTCHKAQGSEFDNVLIDFRGSHWLNDKRTQWLYTAITRAKNNAVVVV